MACAQALSAAAHAAEIPEDTNQGAGQDGDEDHDHRGAQPDMVDRFPCRRADNRPAVLGIQRRSEEHTSELQSLMRISYAVFCLTKKTNTLNKELINV